MPFVLGPKRYSVRVQAFALDFSAHSYDRPNTATSAAIPTPAFFQNTLSTIFIVVVAFMLS